MMKHPTAVEGYEGSLEELAEAVGRMRYDKIVEVLKYLADDMARQAKGDESAGHPKLAILLREHAAQLNIAKEQMKKIWKLCAPYMKDE